MLKKQIDSLQAERKRLLKQLELYEQDIQKEKKSLSLRLSHALIMAMARPGKNTLLIPVRLFKLIVRSVSRLIKKRNKNNNTNGVAPQRSPLKYNLSSPFHKGKFTLLQQGFIPKINLSFDWYRPKRGRVFYLVHSSLPYISNGYAVRSQGILSGLRSGNVDVVGVSRLGFPWDLKKVSIKKISTEEIIDNVTYHRLPTRDSGFSQIPLNKYMQKYLDAVLDLAQTYRPSIIHAASNFVDGHVAVMT